MVKMVVLALLVMAVSCVSASAPGCYVYYNHAAKYNLDPVATSYPWGEVKKAMSQVPMLDQVFAQSTVVPTSRPPGSHYYKPVSEVCPSKRFMLKAFKVDGKQCYVIKPEIQQVRYAHCSDQYNRECHYCSYNKGGVSKCEEDYEWQKVWAYCKPIPKPHPHPYPKPHPQPLPHPRPVPRITPRRYRPVYKPHPKPQPTYPKPHPSYPKPHPFPVQPQPHPHPQPTVYHNTKIYAKPTSNTYYDPYAPRAQYPAGRWKRSVPAVYGGKVEQISLYLPYQCGCKNYKC